MLFLKCKIFKCKFKCKDFLNANHHLGKNFILEHKIYSKLHLVNNIDVQFGLLCFQLKQSEYELMRQSLCLPTPKEKFPKCFQQWQHHCNDFITS